MLCLEDEVQLQPLKFQQIQIEILQFEAIKCGYLMPNFRVKL